MSEEETLGKIAYQTYYKALGLSPELWDAELPEQKQIWIAVAKAVVEHAKQEDK